MRRIFAVGLVSMALVGGADVLGAARSGVWRLDPVDGGSDPDCSGTVRLRRHGGRDSMAVSLRRLDPRTTYEVRDGASGIVLGETRSDRRGRARLRVASTQKSTAFDLRGIRDIEVVDGATGDVVLSGSAPSPSDQPLVDGIGSAYYPVSDIGGASIDIYSVPDFAAESITISFAIGREDGTASWFYDYLADAQSEGGLPLGVARAAELAGRAFEIRDADGNAVLADKLPELEPFEAPSRDGTVKRDTLPGAVDPSNSVPGAADAPRFTLHIADEDGVLQYVADLRFLWGSEIPPRTDDGGSPADPAGGDGTDNSVPGR